MTKVVMVSGGFDPVHSGHINLIREARELGDRLIVVLNTDAWLMRKKGFIFMPYAERAKVLRGLRWVDNVVQASDEDGTVARTIARIRPDVFVNGGDRLPNNTPEVDVCEALNIAIAWGVGGDKTQSSSELVGRRIEERPWGRFEVIRDDRRHWVKILTIDPFQATSLQKHSKRDEVWVIIEGSASVTHGTDDYILSSGDCIDVGAGIAHRIENNGITPLIIIEVATGAPMECDVERISDRYGRT